MEWAEGEVIGSFTDEKGEWIKVRCGPDIRDVLSRDPDLRPRGHQKLFIPAENIENLRKVTAENPVVGQEYKRLIPILSDSQNSR